MSADGSTTEPPTASGSSSYPGAAGHSVLAANASQANSSTASTQRSSTGARKNSAERSIVHTRMEDDDVHNEYQYDEPCGEGSFGKVYRARHIKTGEIVAIKEIVKEKAGSSGLRQLEKEVSIFKKVDHKNIIKLKEVIESPKKMYLIMELCQGGDLAMLLQKRSHLTESDAKVVMSSLAEAIKYLHQQGILHRDLKLENILLAEDPDVTGNIVIKVSDFGLSTIQNNNSYENMQEQYCGTLSYMAPEMNSTYSYPVDVWAMGIIMYYLLTRYPKDNELNESIAKEGPKFEEPQWSSVSEQAKDILREILTVNPAYRPSSGEVLNYEWFTGKKREYGNVLELMKDFSREQKESSGIMATSPDGEEDPASAINGLNISSNQTCSNNVQRTASLDTASKKEPRKGSGGKKATGPDTLHKTASGSGLTKSTKLKIPGTHPQAPSPRPPSKTPTPKSTLDSGTKPSSTSTKANAKTSTTTTANGPSSKASTTATKISTTPKTKRK